MIRFLLDDEPIRIPSWVVDLESFRRGSDDDAFPESGQVSFLKGDVWVEMGKKRRQPAAPALAGTAGL